MKSLGYCMIAMGMVLMFAMGCKSVDSTQTQPPVVVQPAPVVVPPIYKLTGFLDGVETTEKMDVFVGDDGCEYIRNSNSYGSVYTHKGQCKKCHVNDSLLLDRMFFEYIIKTNYEKSEQKMDSTMIIRKTIDSLNAILTGVPK